MAGPPRRPRERFAPRFDALEVRALLSLAPAGAGSTPADRARDLLVRFRADAPPAAVAALLHRLRATVVAAMPDGPSRIAPGPGVSPDAAIGVLAASGEVAYAERDDATYRVAGTIPDDPRFGQQWGLSNPAGNGVDINAPGAWAITTGGNPSTIVAVIDSGVDLAHPDLAGRLWTDPAGGLHGWNFLNNTPNVQDAEGHGTHVAGIIAAAGNDGVGIAGVDWGARLMILKTIDAAGYGSTDAAVAAIHYAVDHGARVINASWDGAQFDPALADAVNYASNRNVVVVVAAGNESANDDAVPDYPASFRAPNEIAVAAVDEAGNLTSFSNYGPRTVAIAAPGADILSTYLRRGYSVLSGTSMAAPFVTGVVALVASEHPGETAAQLVRAVLATARPLPSLAGKVATGGIVDAAAALTYGEAAASILAAPDPDAVHAALLATAEFAAGHGGTDAGFIAGLYRSILGRAPDPAGLAHWLGALHSGGGRREVARRLEATPEANRAAVASWYARDLGRPPDAGSVVWVDRLQRGANPDDVRAAIRAVPEAYVRAAGTPSGFVAALYQSILGRAPDPAGLARWVAILQAGAGRQQVARQLAATPEAHRAEVARWYAQDLGRSPDAGAAAWVARLG